VDTGPLVGKGTITASNIVAVTHGMQVFTSSGTWTRPAGVDYVKVRIYGGGGACAGTASGVKQPNGTASTFVGVTTISGGGGTGGTRNGALGPGGDGSGGAINITGQSGTLTVGSNATTAGEWKDKYGTGGAGSYGGGAAGGYAEGIIEVTGNVTVTIGTSYGATGACIVEW
jgi:hypothetical protein